MTGAERQARYRAAPPAGAPVVRARRPTDRRSRIQRWNDTIAAAVRTAGRVCRLAGSVAGQPTGRCARRGLAGELVNSICRSSRRSSRPGASGVIEQRDGPTGMGEAGKGSN